MTINTEELVATLIEKTRLSINKAEGLNRYSEEALRYKKQPNEWNALECIEHLNLYGDYYNPEIRQCIQNSKFDSNEKFKSGLIGNYFVRLIRPKEELNKMKTLAVNDPIDRQLESAVIDTFIEQQKVFLDLIQDAKDVSLTRTKTGISISKLMKLRLGDTLRFVTAHNERHLIQAESMVAGFKSK